MRPGSSHGMNEKPLVAQRFPISQARLAHELLGKGGVTGKFVLVREGVSVDSKAA